MDQKAIALAAAKALDAKRGKDIVVLKVDEMTVITDYMVIATGRSVPQVKALAENVEEELAKLDLFARRREGVNEGHWCILDYGDVMVHIFHEQDRGRAAGGGRAVCRLEAAAQDRPFHQDGGCDARAGRD